ncbi:beta/gamma crystallin domain-containing protein [Streptomyces coffeae]|uniref:Streptomyces killer toxin-like beta/gamma crystallin domain-containing protein n=1 Tax=Streptomyces coffeae TaxID=621382 RepID=A0ABS1N4T4_9ACTN|nr:beta/gamma crystallin domain-containing protein [Streptomyces coffeae]MBL1095091.1 hypothetical protein [Streptomyces coffeae]
MKHLLKRVVATAAAAVALSAVIPMSSASAIGRVDCTDNGFVWITKLHSGDPDVCFANAGSLDVNIYDVNRVYSGKNNVKFTSDGIETTMGKNQVRRNIDNNGHMTRIEIW